MILTAATLNWAQTRSVPPEAIWTQTDRADRPDARREKGDTPHRKLELDLLVGLAGVVSGRALLDVGCGDGALAIEFAKRGASLTGVSGLGRGAIIWAGGLDIANGAMIYVVLREGSPPTQPQ